MTVFEMSPPASCRILMISSGADWSRPGCMITGAPSSACAIAVACKEVFSQAVIKSSGLS